MAAHPVLVFLNQKRDKITAAVPRTFQAALTWESIVQSVALMLEDPEKGHKLAACQPATIYNSLLTILRLGLDPSPVLQQAFLIPRGNACTAQIGVQGAIELAMRSDRIAKIVAQPVYASDDIECDLSTGYLRHSISKEQMASEKDPGPVIAAYARVWMKGVEEPVTEVLRRWDILKIRRIAAKGGNTPAWRNWEDQMAVRSALKRVLKRVPKSPELMEVLNRGLLVEEQDEREPSLEADVIDAEQVNGNGAAQLADHGEPEDVEAELARMKTREKVPAKVVDADPPFNGAAAGAEDMP